MPGSCSRQVLFDQLVFPGWKIERVELAGGGDQENAI
jgi:hypothetical protein